jgi:hypothetical protein
MEMIPVNSSTISAIGYDTFSASLVVVFLKGGSPYTYHSVPEDVFEAFKEAPSKGKFLDQVIKKGGYPYTKG